MGRQTKKFRYNSRELNEIRRARIKVIVSVSISLLVLAGAYGLSKLGPKRYEDVRREEYKADDPEIAHLREEVLEAKKKIEEMGKVKPLDSEALGKLSDIIQKQRELIVKTREYASISDSTTLEELLKIEDQYVGESLWKESDAAERSAKAGIQSGENDPVLRDLRRALELQKQINTDYPRSSRRDPARAARLQSLLNETIAKPIYVKSVELETAAGRSIKEGDAGSAQVALREAIGLLQVLLQQHRDTRFAEQARMKRLENELASVQSLTSANKLDELLSKASDLEKIGEYTAAGSILQEALVLQSKIIDAYPGSKYASTQKLDEIDILRQTVMSRDLVQTIESKSVELDTALRERKGVQARFITEELIGHLTNLQKNFKRSKWSNDTLQLKLRFLDAVKTNIADVQDEVWDDLVALQGHPDRLLFISEVPQSLYYSIIGQNPSKNVAPNKPVDSVTWDDAHEFCQRLSWLIGYAVVLPTEADYRIALSPEGSLNPDEQIWHSLNANGEVQPIRTTKTNIAGYYDLNGNVSEWLEDISRESPDMVLVAGGSIRDNPVRLRSEYVESRPKNERQRLRGFRFVVVKPVSNE